MENTHYNKYGAYLTAAYVADSIIKSNESGIIKGKGEAQEYYNFGSKVLTTPDGFIDPSNRISISKVAELEGMFDRVNPTNPERTYKQPSEAIAQMCKILRFPAEALGAIQPKQITVSLPLVLLLATICL